MKQVAIWTIAFLIVAPAAAQAADIVLNEYNAVGSDRWLGNPNDPACEGPPGFDCDGSEDVFFGRVMGNGGNWIELVVVTDHLDMRGWKLFWEEVTDLMQGTIFLSDDPLWADVRAGTILTFTELTTAQGGLDTDLSVDPCAGDWWINVNTFDTTYVTTTTSTIPGSIPGNFNTSNDAWRLTILDAADQLVYGPAGEGSVLYPGSGVNNREICRLETEPTSGVTPASPQDDGTHSTFGSFNRWKEDITLCNVYQTIGAARSGPLAECSYCSRLILNEYNAVADDMYLNGGDAAADVDGGQAADGFFGRVLGNGGDWIELVVIEHHLDARGWSIEWAELGLGTSGTITLSTDAFWSDLPAGMIITLIENPSVLGGLDTDLSYDPVSGDVWININTFDATYVASTTSTEPGHVSGMFSVSSKDYVVTIVDGSSADVFGPVGEGSIYYYRDGVSQTNIMRLEDDPTPETSVVSAYDDGSAVSTFGAVNEWTICSSPTPVVQDLSALPDPSCGGDASCPGDVDGNGFVETADFLALLAAWGSNPGHPADIDGNGFVETADFLALLAAWGPCP